METDQILCLRLGPDPLHAYLQLQRIKDAMAAAILERIESSGIPDANDPHFAVWQSIYLEADYTVRTIT